MSTFVENLSDETLIIEKRDNGGYYTNPEDPHAGRTYTPIVFARLERSADGNHDDMRYYAGYDDESGGYVIDLGAPFEDPYYAMRIANSYAQRDAKSEGEYDQVWRAGVEYSESLQEAEEHRVRAEAIKIELDAHDVKSLVLHGIIETEIMRCTNSWLDLREKARKLLDQHGSNPAFQEGRDSA
jgi:hypothetical protein